MGRPPLDRCFLGEGYRRGSKTRSPRAENEASTREGDSEAMGGGRAFPSRRSRIFSLTCRIAENKAFDKGIQAPKTELMGFQEKVRDSSFPETSYILRDFSENLSNPDKSRFCTHKGRKGR